MKMHSKKAKTIRTTFSVVGTLGLAGIFGIGIYNATNIANTSNANALSYSTSNDISFTFAPTLSIGLSTDSLAIDNLVPGTTSDSNKVSVTVSSNTPYGYVLSAGVGSTLSTDPYYNTSDLVHDNSTTTVPTTNKFSSIATSASLQTLDTDNTWGYSTSTDGGANWSTYSGLSNTATKPLLDISDPATPSTIDFKIAARSASTQASGTYNNVITFYAVGKPKPPELMQNTATIKAELKNVGDEIQVQDVRDGNIYWIAKQADGNIWMTQNLDLCIGCKDTATLNSQNTDLNVSGVSAYSGGYKKIDNLITWTPVSTAVTSNYPIVNNYANGWRYDDYIPFSAEGGDTYVYTSNSTSIDIIFSSLDQCSSAGHSPDDCSHYHVGNYYNWSAAIASNSSGNASANFATASNSICPAGWRLPTVTGSGTAVTNREFGELFSASGIISDLNSTNLSLSSFNSIRANPIYSVRGGYLAGPALNGRSQYGEYWYGTSAGYNSTSDSSSAYSFDFGNQSIHTIYASRYRDTGFSIRCLMRQ